MVQFETPIGKVKLARKRSRTVTKIVVLAAVILSIVALLTLAVTIQLTRHETGELQAEAAQLEDVNSRLELYIEELGTVRAIIRIAQEELGLVDADSIIIQPE